MDVILFTSPKAGSGAAREQIPRLVKLLDENEINSQVLSCPGELQRLIRDRRETGVSRPVVIAAGGDGTISLVASRTDSETSLLPMPMGTENLLARMVGQPNDAQAVLNTLQNGTVTQVDAGLANGRLFLIMATAGFDAEVVRRVHLRRKGHISRGSYFKPLLQTLCRYRFPKLTVKTLDSSGDVIGQQHVGWAMAFNMPRYGGNLRILKEAPADDGKLDLITFAGRGIVSGLKYVVGIILGVHTGFKDVKQERVSRLRFEADGRVAYELDGDYVGRLPLEIETLPGRVRLLVPA